MKLFATIPIFPLFLLACTGFFILPKNAAADSVKTLKLGLNAGYRLDRLDWNIAGTSTGQNPNVLSELKWKDLKIWQVGASGKVAVGNDIADYRTYIRASLDYGWITDGTVRDSDYSGNNRSGEIMRSISKTDNDDVLDGSIGLGFEKDYLQKRLTFGWLGGYSYHEQNLRLTDGTQYIPVYESISGLNSTYKSKWQGPFAGIDLELRPSPHFSLHGSAEYHWAHFKAKANWNLRSNFSHPVSFRQEADSAHGLVGTIGGRYAFSNDLILDLSFVYRDFRARNGVDRAFLADGSEINTKLNEVNWKSSTTTLGLTYRF